MDGTRGDGTSGGKAKAYLICASEAPIDESNFDSAQLLAHAPVPREPGKQQMFSRTGLEPEKRWYLALKTVDDTGISRDIQSRVAAADNLGREWIPAGL